MLLFQLIKLFFEDPITGIIALLVITLPLLISITIHEWAHGYTAYKFGDPTPADQGRLSFNPFAHLDPLGTLMLFVIGIGWAKPVQINPNNIHGKYKQMLVALAGPLSNFILATILLFVIFVILQLTNIDASSPQVGIYTLILFMLTLVIRINLVLGLFNLIPIPPLDGSNIIRHLLPEKLEKAYFSLAPFSLPILFILIFTGAIRHLFSFADNIQSFILNGFEYLFGKFF